MTTAFCLSENEGNTNVFINQGHGFTLIKPSSHQVVAVAGGARGSERLKRPEGLNVNGNSTTLRN